jgi:hypothetical protein
MKTLAAAALSLALVGAALPAFAQTNTMGNDTMMNETMTNNTTHHHHHKSNNTHHRHHKMNNTTMNNSSDTTQNLNQNEMNSTTPAQ